MSYLSIFEPEIQEEIEKGIKLKDFSKLVFRNVYKDSFDLRFDTNIVEYVNNKNNKVFSDDLDNYKINDFFINNSNYFKKYPLSILDGIYEVFKLGVLDLEEQEKNKQSIGLGINKSFDAEYLAKHFNSYIVGLDYRLRNSDIDILKSLIVDHFNSIEILLKTSYQKNNKL